MMRWERWQVSGKFYGGAASDCLPGHAPQARVAPGGMVFHVLNRSVGKLHLFRRDGDCDAFVRVMLEARGRHPLRVLSISLSS